MPAHVAPGLPADWLNGWLAAIGITVLLPDVRLGWTHDPVPRAVLVTNASDLEALAHHMHDALPAVDGLAAWSIARDHPTCAEMSRNFGLDVWRERCRVERRRDEWLLAGTVTDLVELGPRDDLPHGAFDVPMPRGVTLHERIVRCRESIESPDHVLDSLIGRPARRSGNGLAFDVRRLDAGVERGGGVAVDPVIELLIAHALALFPTGRTERGDLARSRGWRDRPTRTGGFRWSTWTDALDRWAIDALLDRWHSSGTGHGMPLFETVPYRPMTSSDVTRGYGSRRA